MIMTASGQLALNRQLICHPLVYYYVNIRPKGSYVPRIHPIRKAPWSYAVLGQTYKILAPYVHINTLCHAELRKARMIWIQGPILAQPSRFRTRDTSHTVVTIIY